MNTDNYYLRWRGRQDGPYPLAVLREKLAAGQIGLLHEVYADGNWTSVDDFLQALSRQNKEEEESRLLRARQEQERARQEQQRQFAAQQAAALQEVLRQNDLLAEQLEEMRRAKQNPPPAPGFGQPYPMPYGGMPGAPAYRGTSGMAIAGFVCSMLNFVPFVNFVSWLLALIFGHIALSEIQRTPGLGGRGLAIAALVITYALLGVGVVILLLGVVGITKTRHF